MRITITAQARELGLRHVRGWRIEGARPLLDGPALTAEEAAELATPYGEASGYAELLSRLGHPEQTPAGERSRKLVAERGWRSYGPAIDAVNVATLRHGGGVGLHRIPGEDAEIVVGRGTGQERIVPAFTTKSKPIPAGDLIYGPAGSPMAWLGKRDTDSADYQIQADTVAGVVIALGHPGDDPAHTAAIGDTVREVLALLRPDVELRELG
ncbi:MAG: hypothetical protein HOY71_43145 [Nonomuraea sp.]|nr:hypothetical protein [Nonomuraea sp.]